MLYESQEPVIIRKHLEHRLGYPGGELSFQRLHRQWYGPPKRLQLRAHEQAGVLHQIGTYPMGDRPSYHLAVVAQSQAAAGLDLLWQLERR